jgi:diadenosine tetraphosphate (Ap4A) HIT family hydrolase
MKDCLPKPYKDAIIYEDTKLYACLANFPIAKGHTVVVWKKSVSDLHLLSKRDYEYLMDRVDEIRTAMMKALKVKKVYLLYMDEIGKVHWHLVPRYSVIGFDALSKKPQALKDKTLDDKIRRYLTVSL